jgi:hypothetical protein
MSYFQKERKMDDIISKTIPSATIVHRYNDRHTLVKCSVKDLVMCNHIDNWEFNRPPDMHRCVAIADYIYDTKPALDWMIYVVYDGKLKIIDGLHRYSALVHLWRENHKTVDFITPSKYGCNGDAVWLYSKDIFLSIRVNHSMGEIVDVFQSLNKSNPIPELYMDNSDSAKREIIESIVAEWQQKFKSHFTVTSKPNIPNINRDRFIDLLDKLYQKYNITRNTAHVLSDKLYETNHYIRNNIPKKITETALTKCRETNCYLFLVKKEILENMI